MGMINIIVYTIHLNHQQLDSTSANTPIYQLLYYTLQTSTNTPLTSSNTLTTLIKHTHNINRYACITIRILWHIQRKNQAQTHTHQVWHTNTTIYHLSESWPINKYDDIVMRVFLILKTQLKISIKIIRRIVMENEYKPSEHNSIDIIFNGTWSLTCS